MTQRNQRVKATPQQKGPSKPSKPRKAAPRSPAVSHEATATMEAIIRDFGLSAREARFVVEVCVDGNASAAYVRAGYSERNANVNSSRMMAKDRVKAALARVRAKVAEEVGFTAAEALAMAADILRADPRELIEHRVGCCRFCYGEGHLYQRTAGEMARDRARHEQLVARRKERNKDHEDPGFDAQGGDGYDIRRDPNPECPACGGEGQGRVVINDTRKVSKAAAALYAGVKETKDGIEVKLHDKTAMLDKMFRYHGLYEADNRQKAHEAADPALLAALGEAMAQSQRQYAATLEARRQSGFPGD